MSVAADSCKGDVRRAVAGEGDFSSVSALQEVLLRQTALQTNGGAEAAGDPGGDYRTPQPLLGGSPGSGEGLHRELPEVDDRWWRFGGVSFCGVPAAQYWVEFILWETLLNEKAYSAIVELGTWQGGFSLYLATQAEGRELIFRTYDIKSPERHIPGFVQLDIFAHAEEIGEHLRSHEPVILFCDGGNKPRELKTFSRYLGPESTIVVHDWGTEMLPVDVPDNVQMIHEEWCLDLGSLSRVFRVRDA